MHNTVHFVPISCSWFGLLVLIFALNASYYSLLRSRALSGVGDCIWCSPRLNESFHMYVHGLNTPLLRVNQQSCQLPSVHHFSTFSLSLTMEITALLSHVIITAIVVIPLQVLLMQHHFNSQIDTVLCGQRTFSDIIQNYGANIIEIRNSTESQRRQNTSSYEIKYCII